MNHRLGKCLGPEDRGRVLTEKEWDSLLKIQTTGRDDSKADQYRYPYEPTPYPVLERLAGSGLIGKKTARVVPGGT